MSAVLLASPAINASAELFRFRDVAGEQYRIVTETEQDIYQNGQYSHRASVLFKIGVEVLEATANAALLDSRYQTSERQVNATGAYGPLLQDYQSVFWRDRLGIYDVPDEYFMPVVRHVPTFPLHEIEPGDEWFAMAEEVHDFREDFGLGEPFRFPVNVHYRYTGNERSNDRNIALFDIEYTFFHVASPEFVGRGAVPEKIAGYSRQRYRWDRNVAMPVSYEEEYHFLLHLTSGDYYEFIGSGSGEVVLTEPLDRRQAVEDIRRGLAEQGIEDASVKEDDDGVTIVLENIQFPPDSAVLVPREQEKLRRIGIVLGQYPARDILITGHTARVGTEESSQLLSEERARTVGDFLIAIGSRDAETMVFRGMGSRQPIGTNATDVGRRQNRRVEITILEN